MSGGAYRKLKHGNKFTVCGSGHNHRSKAEAKRCDQLALLEKAALISNVEQQPRFPCSVNGVKLCTYVADFAYHENGKLVIEDVKGFPTAIYKLKKKIMAACHPTVTIVEIAA